MPIRRRLLVLMNCESRRKLSLFCPGWPPAKPWISELMRPFEPFRARPPYAGLHSFFSIPNSLGFSSTFEFEARESQIAADQTKQAEEPSCLIIALIRQKFKFNFKLIMSHMSIPSAAREQAVIRRMIIIIEILFDSPIWLMIRPMIEGRTPLAEN